jgi:predicted Fe-Mo cluster-binding NifX family protein
MNSGNIKTVGIFLVLSAVIGFSTMAGARPELIAVAAEGPSADAAISDVAARAPYFLIFRGDGSLVEAHVNPVAADRGAGPLLAAWLSKHQVRILIAGRFGPKLTRALDAHAIQGLTMTGSVSEAIAALRP